jgi:hypothetical protein
MYLHVRIYGFLLAYTRSRPNRGIENLDCALPIIPILVPLCLPILPTLPHRLSWGIQNGYHCSSYSYSPSATIGRLESKSTIICNPLAITTITLTCNSNTPLLSYCLYLSLRGRGKYGSFQLDIWAGHHSGNRSHHFWR